MSKLVDSLLARVEALNGDPLSKGGPQIITHIRRTIKVTDEELREAIAANPKHQIAKVYRQSLKEGPASYRVVEAIDLEALLTDQDVVTLRGRDEDGTPFSTKQIKPRPIKEAKKQGVLKKPKGPPSKKEMLSATPPAFTSSPKEEPSTSDSNE